MNDTDAPKALFHDLTTTSSGLLTNWRNATKNGFFTVIQRGMLVFDIRLLIQWATCI
jgi:hypothetical protein